MNTYETLQEFSNLIGIEESYWDNFGNEHVTSEHTKRSILTALGYPSFSDHELHESYNAFMDRRWGRWLDPVSVLRTGRGPEAMEVTVRLPKRVTCQTLRWTIICEDGQRITGKSEPRKQSRQRVRTVKGEVMLRMRLRLPSHVPEGYHKLELICPDLGSSESMLIVAPSRSYLPDDVEDGGKLLGIAAHVYSLRSKSDWGMGDFADLAEFSKAAGAVGAQVVGVNPLHALYPHNPEHASPYSPSSRLFLNPLYIDVEAVPEYADGIDLQAYVKKDKFKKALKEARAQTNVDYTAVASIKWPAFELLYDAFVAKHSDPDDARRKAFQAFQDEMGEPLRGFAIYQALADKYEGKPWFEWPEKHQDPASPDVAKWVKKNYDRVEYQMYLQWVADEQLAEAARQCEAAGMSVGLYRDLAVGMDPAGSDAWSDPAAIVRDARFGAPPDAFNPNGQDWGMPPPHPVTLKEREYEPFIAMLRANMRHAGALRIDHVMGILHLYWILQGQSAGEGSYVAYPFDDLLGIIALESHRNECLVIGEDLGTVPPGFRERMAEEVVLSYKLFYFERWDGGLFMRPDVYPVQALSTPTTHDLPTIVGYWRGNDVTTQRRIGVIGDDGQMHDRLNGRRGDCEALLAALEDQGVRPSKLQVGQDGDEQDMKELVIGVSRYLGRTESQLVMLNVDDLFLEPDQLNFPGTVTEYPNWRRRVSGDVNEFRKSKFVKDTMKATAKERKG